MKKYKLIKKYPGSPMLGTVLVMKRNGWYESENSNQNPHSPEVIENNPEFWEEVKKEYEILSFYAKNIGGKDEVNPHYMWYETRKGSNIWSRMGNITSPYTTGEILENKNYAIHSVRRLSDGEVFTVGDVCEFGKITKIFITEDGYCMTATPTSNYSCNLLYLKKTKPVLFTTEDGVDIREGDDCYITWNYKFGEPIYPEICKLNWEVFFRMADDNVYFSTREKAEEYILLNKPCLSINDIKKTGSIGESFGNIGAYLNITELEKLVKSRL